jgi:Fur family ferric uptake transcriptional regulator
MCEKCHEVFEVENDLLMDIESDILKKYGFKVKNHNVMFYGVCKKCEVLE